MKYHMTPKVLKKEKPKKKTDRAKKREQFNKNYLGPQPVKTNPYELVGPNGAREQNTNPAQKGDAFVEGGGAQSPSFLRSRSSASFRLRNGSTPFQGCTCCSKLLSNK